MVKYLLDSNVLSEPAKPAPNPGVMHRLQRNQAEVATAAPVYHEMLHGVQRLPASKRRSALEDYLDSVFGSLQILPYDAAAARWHAEERARLHRRTPPLVDSQIAAVAAVNNLILVTANLSDYAFFQGLKRENGADVVEIKISRSVANHFLQVDDVEPLVEFETDLVDATSVDKTEAAVKFNACGLLGTDAGDDGVVAKRPRPRE